MTSRSSSRDRLERAAPDDLRESLREDHPETAASQTVVGECRTALCRRAEPGKGHAEKSDEWRAKFPKEEPVEATPP